MKALKKINKQQLLNPEHPDSEVLYRRDPEYDYDPNPLTKDDLKYLAGVLSGTDQDLDDVLVEWELDGRETEPEIRTKLRTVTELWQCERCGVWTDDEEWQFNESKYDVLQIQLVYPHEGQSERPSEILTDSDGCPLFFHTHITGSETLPSIEQVVAAVWEELDADKLAYESLLFWKLHSQSKNHKLKQRAIEARNIFAMYCLRAAQIVATKCGWFCGWGGDDNADKLDICVEVIFEALDAQMHVYDDGIENYDEFGTHDAYYKTLRDKYRHLLSWRDIEWIKTLCRRRIDVEKNIRRRKQVQADEDIEWDDTARVPAALGRSGNSRQPWELAHEWDILERSYGKHFRKMLDPAYDELPFRKSRSEPQWLSRQKLIDDDITDDNPDCKIDRRIVQLKMTYHRIRCEQIAEIILGEFGQKISGSTVERRLNKYLQKWEKWADEDMRPGRFAKGSSSRVDMSVEQTA